jgi:hypothetical protein
VAESIVLDASGGTTVTCSSLPAIIGDAVVAVEPLRHGQGNAAIGGIWRVRGTSGSSILKLATPPAPRTASAGRPTSDEPAHWNYWRRETLAYTIRLAATAYRDQVTAPARQLRRLWAARYRVLGASEATERTLCHLDVWPANLIDHAGSSVLLDWAFTGDGAVGEDVAT